MNDMTLWYV